MTYTLTVHAPYESGEDQTRTVDAESLHGYIQHLLNLGFTITVAAVN